MKKSLAGCLLVACCLIAAPVSAKKGDDQPQKISKGVHKLLKKHDKALKKQDLDGVMNTYVDDNAILIGTGPDEFWVGDEQIKEAYQHFFADYDPGALEVNCTWRSTGDKGGMAWLMAMCQFTDYLKNVRRDYAVNISAVAERSGKGWQFRTFHISNITAPE